MKSPLFAPKTREGIERKVRDLLNQQADFLSSDTAESTRAAGDASQSILEDNFAEILGDLVGEYSASFARRAMADLAFKDKVNNYCVVDVKTHREGNPNPWRRNSWPRNGCTPGCCRCPIPRPDHLRGEVVGAQHNRAPSETGLPLFQPPFTIASMPMNQDQRGAGLNRRRFLSQAAVAGAGGILAGRISSALAADTVILPFANGERPLVQYPQKRPLIRLTTRPPQLETPFSVFNEGVITPNDAFFVRYHLAQIPTEIDPAKFRLEIKGKVSTPLVLPLDHLKRFEAVEVVAVNQCSGNGRGFFQPRVAGGQLGNGAMGNARWKGARLKDVLKQAGVAAGAKQVIFNGLDTPTAEKTPDLIKAIDVDQALDGELVLAYEMNGEELPMLNGFPLRLVVPGHFGTYWIKHLNEITVTDEAFNGFWMNPGYRIPDNEGACVEPGATPAKTRPITRFNVRSFITSLADGDKVSVGREQSVRGIAFDGGYGLNEILFSDDGGRTWREAQLGKDLGKYSFREWTIPFKAARAGAHELKVKATNRIGQSQPKEALWNPAGYMRNVIETVRVNAA